ncbi:hypothetical protein JVU11DRAFT_3630 [Chiua virens]|nr:hypothetical protein JVU11DRAFT_3630 [Chiua virens]
MPTHTMFPLQRPTGIPSAYLAAYKNLRLTSLQVDPQAFGSTYAREVAWSDDVWRQHMDSPCKRTVIASVRDKPGDGKDHGDGTRDRDAEACEGEWIGMASIVAPSDMPPLYMAPFKQAGVGSNWEIYGLFGMWVDHAHRGKGLGARLVEECLEWARAHVDPAFSTLENGRGSDREKVVVLMVYENNAAGVALYSKMGFVDLKGLPPREGHLEGEKWMLAKL